VRDDQRERHQDVEDALQDEIEPAAEIGAGDAETSPISPPPTAARSRDPSPFAPRTQAGEDIAGRTGSVPNRCRRLGATIMELKSLSSGSNGCDPFGEQPCHGEHDDDYEGRSLKRLAAAEVERPSSGVIGRKAGRHWRRCRRTALGDGGHAGSRCGFADRARRRARRPRDW